MDGDLEKKEEKGLKDQGKKEERKGEKKGESKLGFHPLVLGDDFGCEEGCQGEGRG